MTSSSQQPIPPAIVPALLDNDDATQSDREVVGASDADADAARSGTDIDLDSAGAERDSDGVPVGRADLEADKERSA